MDNTFLNLARGNRLSQYMGLKNDDGNPIRYGKDYSYIEIGVREVYNPSEEKVVTKVLRNQHVKIIPACKVNVKGGYKILVKTNPLLQEVANCPALFVLDSDCQEEVAFYASFRKDMDISQLEWAVRLYMVG
jgi:hypothetical protein